MSVDREESPAARFSRERGKPPKEGTPTMTITVSTTDPRSLKALAVLETADRWQKGRTNDGRSFWAIPSETQRGLLHMTSTRECSCPDYQRRGIACKHMLAARLRVAQLQAEQPRRRARLAALATDVWGHDGDGS